MNPSRTAPRRLLLLPLCLLLAAGVPGCGRSGSAVTNRVAGPAPAAPTSARTSLVRAVAAQERASRDLLARPEVAGTGAAIAPDGTPEIVVLLESARVPQLPLAVDGVRVRPVVIGTLRPWSLTGTYRPVPIGVSAGNAIECLPGTIACVLQRGSRKFLLSANHVFARQNQAAIGEAIVQPSLPDLDPACGPAPSSAVVAHLSDFQPVVYDGKTPNLMDAAIAEFDLPPSQLSASTPDGGYGAPSATPVPPAADLPVMKLGRTTGLTHAVIKAINVKVKLGFPSGTALFVGQVLTSPGFGAFGDSGALVVAEDGANGPVGMVIGGSNNGSAIVSPIGPILDRFAASIATR
jgi:hypothetical protein